MYLIKSALAAIGLAFLLSACTPPEPMVFGVPQSQWNTLSSNQKQQVIQGYNQREEINAENAPINNAIGAASQVIQQNNAYKHMQNNVVPSMPTDFDMPPMPSMP